MALATGGVIVEITIPDRPAISSVTDAGNESSITAAVIGTGTIQLYYRIKNTSAWTTGLSRSGAGNIIQTGLTAGKWYEFYITDTVDSIASPPSAISTIRVLEGDDTTIETAFRAIMAEDETIAAIVADRIYPVWIPQKAALPAIVYQQIAGSRVGMMKVSSLAHPRFQVLATASTYRVARELAEAVRKALSGYSGTVNMRQIQAINLIDEGDIPSQMAGVDVLEAYSKRMDFEVWFIEPTS